MSRDHSLNQPSDKIVLTRAELAGLLLEWSEPENPEQGERDATAFVSSVIKDNYLLVAGTRVHIWKDLLL